MAFSITGNLTSGSSAIASVSSTTSIAVGMLVDNANVPAGTVVSAVDSGAAVITMSAPATASGTGETIEFVSSFATAVSTTVTVATAPLVAELTLEADVDVTVVGSVDLNSGQNERLATDVIVSVTGSVDLSAGRNDILETSIASMSVTVVADLQNGRGEILETAAGVLVSVTATADLTDQNVALDTAVSVSASASADLDMAGRALFDAIELYMDVVSRQLVTLSAGHASVAARKLFLKRNDRPLVRLRFVRDDKITDIPDGTVVAIGAKPKGNYGGSMVFHSASMVRYLDAARLPYYEDTLNLGTAAVAALFTVDTLAKVECTGEVELSTPSLSAVSSSQEFAIELWNDVVRGAATELACANDCSVTAEADLTLA